jgi:hypothetical protein
MSWLPRVVEHTRERVSREFDSLGPDACVFEISENLRANNPELLDIAIKCARDVGEPADIMVGFGMFYRLLLAQSSAALPPAAQAGETRMLDALPRVTSQTRDLVLKHIERQGAESFTRQAIDEMERGNPQLLLMAHDFASRHKDYLGTMQGFALMYVCLAAQADADRISFH